MAQNSLRPDLLLALTELLVGRTGMATLRDRADEVDAAACERSTAAGCHSGDEFAAALLGGELGREEVDDLVGCRNVMIYFEPAVVARLAKTFFSLLKPGGWLVTGASRMLSWRGCVPFRLSRFVFPIPAARAERSGMRADPCGGVFRRGADVCPMVRCSGRFRGNSAAIRTRGDDPGLARRALTHRGQHLSARSSPIGGISRHCQTPALMNQETRTARTPIGRKLNRLFAGICIAFFAIIGYAVWHIHRTGDELRVLAESQIPALSANGRAQAAIFLQQQITDNFVTEATADAAARFREAGLPSQFLIDESEEARKFREMVATCITKEQAQGHVDAAKSDALSVEKLAEVYRTFQANATTLFAATTRDQAHAAGDQAGDVLMRRLQKFDRVLLGFVAEDAADLLATERNLVILLIVASAVVLGTALVVSARFVGRITEPLATLTRLAARIAEGDLGTKPDVPATGDEIEILAASFDSMGRSLRAQIEEIRKSSELLSAAISEIGASIQEQAASAKEEAATIQEITTTMQEIQQSGSEISQRAKEVSTGAESTLDAGEDGLEAVRRTSGGARKRLHRMGVRYRPARQSRGSR